MKSTNSIFLVSVAIAVAYSVNASADDHMAHGNAHGAMLQPAAGNADLTEGEVRKIDKAGKKITIKHGEIKNLGMPGMTMVFSVSNPAMLDRVRAGERIRFKAEQSEGALVVSEIRLAK